MALTHSPKIVTTGLVLCLDGGNTKSYPGNGAIWTDITGNGRNGDLTGGISYSSGNNGSLSFGGSNGWSPTIGNIPTIGTGDFAIEAWIYLPAVTATACWRAIVSIGNGHLTSGGVTLYAPRATAPVNTAVAILNTVNPTIGGTSNVNNSVWHQIVLTRISSTLSLYVDTVSEASQTNTANITQTSVIVGRDVNCSTTYFQGNISGIKIYTGKGLTQSEVSQNFNAVRKRFNI
jgi:hypothetical protein